MILERIDLFSYFQIPRNGRSGGVLIAYRHGQIEELGVVRTRPALLVIPGGAYGMLSQKEAEPVALRFFAAGFDCFLLAYDVAPHAYPTQLEEAAMAMLYLRREGERLSLNGRVGAIGFSAGGHLAGCLACLWRDRALTARFGASCDGIRPDAAALCYPVVTADRKYWHRDTFLHFCGGDETLCEQFSLEKHVPEDAPPVFLWATGEDDFVPRENAVLLYMALRARRVPAELHIFEEGGHGFSTADLESNGDYCGQRHYRRAARWVELALDFFAAHGFQPMTK